MSPAAALELTAVLLGLSAEQTSVLEAQISVGVSTAETPAVAFAKSSGLINVDARRKDRNEHVKALEDHFSSVDRSGSGKLDRQSLVDMATQLDSTLSREECTALFALMDTDHSGSLDLQESMRWWIAHRQGNAPGKGVAYLQNPVTFSQIPVSSLLCDVSAETDTEFSAQHSAHVARLVTDRVMRSGAKTVSGVDP